jgi:large subunit ribosomal protein L24
MKLVKKDRVKVIAGKDKGKTGEITKVLMSEGKVVVHGVNVYKKATKPTKRNPQGGIIEVTKPVDISNVALICPSCGKPTRIGYQMTKKGVKDRVCKACKGVVKE